jgi:hypothetical protein
MEASLFIHESMSTNQIQPKRLLTPWNILYAKFTTIFEQLYSVMLQTSSKLAFQVINDQCFPSLHTSWFR